MKSDRHLFFLALVILCVFAMIQSIFAGPYSPLKQPGPKKEESAGPMAEPLLEVNRLPTPFPSRRQIIDADKGSSCLKCHRMPYPTAPPMGAAEDRAAQPAIPLTHPGGWSLMTARPHPFHKVAEGWSPDGNQLLYSLNLFQDDWDIWVVNRTEHVRFRRAWRQLDGFNIRMLQDIAKCLANLESRSMGR